MLQHTSFETRALPGSRQPDQIVEGDLGGPRGSRLSIPAPRRRKMEGNEKCERDQASAQCPFEAAMEHALILSKGWRPGTLRESPLSPRPGMEFLNLQLSTLNL